jgi:hypothetical protein
LKDSFIVVWQSGRLAPGDLREGFKFSADIVGCRVDKSGNALDAKPFVICKADDLQERPRMAAAHSTGSGQGQDVALVVWQDLRNGKDWDVYGARVSPEGKVLDPDGFLISGGAHNQANPQVAWDGKTFVVVWQDLREGKTYRTFDGYVQQKYEVCVARVSAEGKVLDPQGIKISTQQPPCYNPAVASAGDGRSFVVWCTSNNGALGAVLVDGKVEKEFRPDGNEPSKPPKRENQRSFAGVQLFMAAGKDVCLLARRNECACGRGNANEMSNAWLFDAQGVRNGSPSLKGAPEGSFTLAGAPHRVLNADLAWDGSAFVAAWTEYRTKNGREYEKYPTAFTCEHIFASRIATDGKPAGPVQPVAGAIEAPATNACAASDGAGTSLVAYEKHAQTGETPIRIGVRMLTAK